MKNTRNIDKLTKNDKVVKTPKYYETTEYEKFAYFDSNRSVEHTASGTVSRRGNLKNSLKKYGWCLYLPVLVMEKDDKFYIYDGQHRFELAKELKIPVIYQIVEPEFLPIEFVSKINSTSKKWSTYDFIKSYASGRNDVSEETTKSYQKLLEKADGYRKYCTLTNLIKICNGKFVRGTCSDYKNGVFSYDFANSEEIDYILNYFKDNYDLLHKNKGRCDCKTSAIVVMLDACYRCPKIYNIEKFTKVLDKTSSKNSTVLTLGELDTLMKMNSKNYRGCLVDYYYSNPIPSKAAA